MNIILENSWAFFITLELLSLAALILFGVVRYFFNQHRMSLVFIGIFLALLVLEAVLALYVYRNTGEISTFQIVIAIFIIYAFTFGIFDFIRLDRWMRIKIGKLRGVELLTKKDYEVIEKNNNPKYIAKKYRISSYIHLVIFVIVQSVFWVMGTDSMAEINMYLTDFSWLENGDRKSV